MVDVTVDEPVAPAFQGNDAARAIGELTTVNSVPLAKKLNSILSDVLHKRMSHVLTFEIPKFKVS